MFTGCGTALVTPFRQDLSLDEDALRRLVRRQIEAGINFLVPCGTTGESPTLSARGTAARGGNHGRGGARAKTPVLAGAGGNNTAHVIEMAREFEKLGARRDSFGGAVLQQAHAGRPLPALQSHRRGDFAADHSLQHSRAHGRQHRAGHGRAARGNRKHRRREGSVREYFADGGGARQSCRSDFWCSRATTGSRCR